MIGRGDELGMLATQLVEARLKRLAGLACGLGSFGQVADQVDVGFELMDAGVHNSTAVSSSRGREE